MINTTTYKNRREQLKSNVKNGIILLLGNEESSMNYLDNTYHFRQDSTFLYYFGLNQAGLCATIDAESGEECIYGNELTIDDYVWMGYQPTIKEKAESAGVNKTQTPSDLSLFLQAESKKGRQIHFLPPYRPEHSIKLLEWLNFQPNEVASKASEELCYAVANQRNHKSEDEIAEIEKSVDVSTEMHKLAMRMAKPGVNEAEIAAAVDAYPASKGGVTSFPTIATINGQTLHNHYHGNILKEGDLFLLDAGAELTSGYAGDLSSTVPVSGKFTPFQKEIYELALASHNKAIELLKPGLPFKDVYYASARIIVDGMKDFGIMKGNTDDALVNGAHAMFFPCGLGHMMGLDVHDMENIGEVIVGYGGEAKSTQFGAKSLRLGRKLEPGFILTIEPGIYFIPQLIDLWQKESHNKDYFNFDKLNEHRDFGGIRNEEDLLITETGSRILGSISKPKSVDDVLAQWAKGL